jgi:hypothetical protein
VSESCCGREACSCCGSDTWTEAHFRHGQGIICQPCWREIQATKGKRPLAQQTLNLGPVTQPQGAIRG